MSVLFYLYRYYYEQAGTYHQLGVVAQEQWRWNQAWCTTGPQNYINGAGLLSVDGFVYGVYNPSFNGGLVEAMHPQNGQIYWSKGVDFEASNDPPILSQGDNLILPIGGIVLSRAHGNTLWQFPASVLVAAVNA